MTPAEPDAGDVLKAAIERGLRKSRHEEAPIPVVRESDIFHITHMIYEEIKDVL